MLNVCTGAHNTCITTKIVHTSSKIHIETSCSCHIDIQNQTALLYVTPHVMLVDSLSFTHRHDFCIKMLSASLIWTVTVSCIYLCFVYCHFNNPVSFVRSCPDRWCSKYTTPLSKHCCCMDVNIVAQFLTISWSYKFCKIWY